MEDCHRGSPSGRIHQKNQQKQTDTLILRFFDVYFNVSFDIASDATVNQDVESHCVGNAKGTPLRNPGPDSNANPGEVAR